MSARKNKETAEEFRERIVDTALELASRNGWSHYKLTPIAEEMGVTVNDIRRHFADPNAIADAWFARALEAMLAPPPKDFRLMEPKKRLEFLLWRWFETLAPYRKVTRQMLAEKLHLPHIHHWVPAIFALSRKLQLLRDSAFLLGEGQRRQVEEIGLTILFLTTLCRWCFDKSPGQEKTKRHLSRWLRRADRVLAKC